MVHIPPTDIWESSELLKFDQPLKEGDPLYVDVTVGRGEFSQNRLYRYLGVQQDKGLTFKKPKKSEYIVFCGHRGCGKSTELRRLATRLHQPNLFFVIFLDVVRDLDINNLQYPDVLMYLASALLVKMDEENIKTPAKILEQLQQWFNEKVIVETKAQDKSFDLKIGAEGKTGLPLIAKLFASLTTSFKINATYKNELRRSIKNNFSEFAYVFNQLIEAAQDAIQTTGKGAKLLFVVDGTDRSNSDDTKRFFIDDAHQLQLITANFIFCCPINLLHEGNTVQQMFKHHILPMIKLSDEDGEIRFEPGYEVLRKMILRRASRSLFDSDETLERVIESSGGNPREAIKILEKAFSLSETDRFDAKAVTAAIDDLATDYRRFLKPEDYHILYAIDHGLTPDWEQERENELLYNLALLEYNSFWRRSHPVTRRLKAYRKLATGTGSTS